MSLKSRLSKSGCQSSGLSNNDEHCVTEMPTHVRPRGQKIFIYVNYKTPGPCTAHRPSEHPEKEFGGKMVHNVYSAAANSQSQLAYYDIIDMAESCMNGA